MAIRETGSVDTPALPALRSLLPRLRTAQLLHVAALALWLAACAVPRTLLRWQRRARSRAALATLDERLLRDVGLQRVHAARERRKWFWQG
jgi:uncharacterized protein YjiS (DUF1127 family)